MGMVIHCIYVEMMIYLCAYFSRAYAAALKCTLKLQIDVYKVYIFGKLVHCYLKSLV